MVYAIRFKHFSVVLQGFQKNPGNLFRPASAKTLFRCYSYSSCHANDNLEVYYNTKTVVIGLAGSRAMHG